MDRLKQKHSWRHDSGSGEVWFFPDKKPVGADFRSDGNCASVPATRAYRPRISRRSAFVGALIFIAAGRFGSAQESSPKPDAPSATAASAAKPAGGKTADAPPATPTDPRQAQILADTKKLLKLSQELQAEVAKSNKDTLSLTVIKKAEEVEKLAKTLKEEMAKSR